MKKSKPIVFTTSMVGDEIEQRQHEDVEKKLEEELQVLKKRRRKKMSEKEKYIEDMSLENKPQEEKPLDMNLEGPDPGHLGVRIAKLFPDTDVIDLIKDLQITRMADHSYRVKDKTLKELSSMDLEKIDKLLKSKGG